MLPSLRAAELRRALRRQPDSYTAYEHTLRALDIINMPDRATSDQAREFLDLAMAEDPGFAMPVAWAAWWHCLRVGQGWAEDPPEETARAVSLAARAIRLDPGNALALATHGHLLSYLRRVRYRVIVFRPRPGALPKQCVRVSDVEPDTDLRRARGRGAGAGGKGASHLAHRPEPLPVLQSSGTGTIRARRPGGRGALGAHVSRRKCWLHIESPVAFIAALAALGRREEARDIAAELMALEPGFRMGDFERSRQPFKVDAARVRFVTALRDAGLPE